MGKMYHYMQFGHYILDSVKFVQLQDILKPIGRVLNT